MSQFENKSFSVQMRSGAAPDDLQKRWEQTFGKHETPAQQEPEPASDAPRAAQLMQLYALLSEQTQLGGVLERNKLHDALDVIWYRLSPAERDQIQR